MSCSAPTRGFGSASGDPKDKIQIEKAAVLLAITDAEIAGQKFASEDCPKGGTCQGQLVVPMPLDPVYEYSESTPKGKKDLVLNVRAFIYARYVGTCDNPKKPKAPAKPDKTKTLTAIGTHGLLKAAAELPDAPKGPTKEPCRLYKHKSGLPVCLGACASGSCKTLVTTRLVPDEKVEDAQQTEFTYTCGCS